MVSRREAVKPWSELTTGEFASEIVRTLLHAIQAHTDCPRSAEDAVRRFDGKTPYAVHPLWCAMTILLEAQLDAELRRIGYQALAWHDTLEDTTLGLPDTVDPRVRALVEELTFARDEDERVLIWQRSRDAKLLKLYDKVANLLDNRTWRPAESWNAWAAYTLELARFVEGEFGRLNIVRIAHALAAS